MRKSFQSPLSLKTTIPTVCGGGGSAQGTILPLIAPGHAGLAAFQSELSASFHDIQPGVKQSNSETVAGLG